MMLAGKSLVELRSIAQSYDIPDIFEMTDVQLRQAIESKAQVMAQSFAPKLPERPGYDARLTAWARDRRAKPSEIMDVLQPHIALGLHVKIDEESWYMAYGERNDQGTIRMPLRTVLHCAERLMNGKRRA